MKIAIEAQRIFRKEKHGMEFVAIELIRHLQKIDHINEYFIIVKQDEDSGVVLETSNFHVVELKKSPYPLWEQYYLPRAIKKIKPDILHCTSNTAPLNVNVSTVLTLHDIIFMNKETAFKGSLYQKFGNMYRYWLVPKIIPSCNFLITVSEYEKRRICDYFSLKGDTVSVIYNAYDSQRFIKVDDDLRLTQCKLKYGLPDRFIFHLGNTDPRKNLEGVLKALAYLHQELGVAVPLVISGINGEYLDKILLKCGLTGIKPHVHLIGYLSNDDLPIIYNLASIFLFPSFEEGFGIPILEAMACGVPVLTSNCSAMPEIAGGAAFLVNPRSFKDLATGIRDILESDKLHDTLVEGGEKRIEYFNWIASAYKVLSIYQKVYASCKSTLEASIL